MTQEQVKERFKKLIRYSDPDKNRKTLFIWPEGVFSGYSYNDILIFNSTPDLLSISGTFLIVSVNFYLVLKKSVQSS